MFRNIAAVLLLVFISGCTPTPSSSELNINDPAEWSIPEGLKDCQIYNINSPHNVFMWVVRCPKSTTSTQYRCGKNCQSNIVVDSE